VRDALDLVVSVLVDGLRFVVGQVLVAVALLVVLVLQRIGEAQAQGRGEDQILQDQIVGGIISNRAQTSTNCFRRRAMELQVLQLEVATLSGRESEGHLLATDCRYPCNDCF